MSNIELNIVALGDFTSVNDAIAKLKANVASLNASLAGATGASFDKAAASVKGLSTEFAAALTNSGAFTKQTVSLQSETEKFGQSLQKGTLGLGSYYQILTKQQGAATNSVKALALEQTKLQNSIVMSDPTKSGFYSVLTPKSIDAVSNATKIAANEQNIYNIALRSGSNELINWGKNTQWAGRQLTVGMALPLLIFGQQAVSAFDSVNTALTQLQKVYGEGLTPPSQDSINEISQQVLNLGRSMAQTLGISQEFTVQVATQFAAMGKQGNDLLTITEQTDRLAKLGSLDQQTATNAVIALQNVYKMNTSQLADAVNYFGAMQKQTSLSMSDLVQSESRVGPIIEELGGTYKDSAVMVLAMKEAGVPAAKSANALKSAMASIINPTSAATKEFASFGINLNNIKDQKGPVNMILALQQALAPLSKMQQEQLIDKLFGKYQFGNITALIQNLGKAGSQTVNALQVANATSGQLATLANQEINQVTSSPSAQWQKALATFKADLYPIGQDIIKIGTKVLELGNKISSIFQGLPGPVKFFLGLLAGLTVLAGPIIMLTGLMANFVGNILKGVINFKDLVSGGKSMRQLFTPEIIAAQNATNLFADGLKGDVDEVQLLTQAIQDLTEKLAIMKDQLGVGAGLDELKTAVGATAQVETSIFEQMALPGFKDGGIIYGPGTGTSDSILARVSNGETILTAEQTKKNIGAIAAIVSGQKIPGFRKGKLNKSDLANKSEQDIADDVIYASGMGDKENIALSEEVRGALRDYYTQRLQAIKAAKGKITLSDYESLHNEEVTAESFPEGSVLRKRYDEQIAASQQSGGGYSMTMRGMSSDRYAKEKLGSQFSHLGNEAGNREDIANINANTIADEKARNDLIKLQKLSADRVARGDDPILASKHGGLGYDFTGTKNSGMGKGGSIPQEEFLPEFSARGIDKWKTSFKIAGADFQKMPKEVQDALKKWDKDIVENLKQTAAQNGGFISDADVKAAEQKARESLGKATDAASKTAKSIIDAADNTLTEVRFAVTDAASNAEIESATGRKTGAINAKGENNGIGRLGGYKSSRFREGLHPAGGMGVVELDPELGVPSSGTLKSWKDKVLARAKSVWQIASPSGVADEEIGQPIGQGVVQGFTSTGSDLHAEMLNLIPGIESIAPMTQEASEKIGSSMLDGITVPLDTLGGAVQEKFMQMAAEITAEGPALTEAIVAPVEKAKAEIQAEQMELPLTSFQTPELTPQIGPRMANGGFNSGEIAPGIMGDVEEAESASSSSGIMGKIKKFTTKENGKWNMGAKMGGMTALSIGGNMAAGMLPKGSNLAGAASAMSNFASMGMMIGPEGAIAGAAIGLVTSGIGDLMKAEKEHQATVKATFTASTADIKMMGDTAYDVTAKMNQFIIVTTKTGSVIKSTLTPAVQGYVATIKSLSASDPTSLFVKSIAKMSSTSDVIKSVQAKVAAAVAAGMNPAHAKDYTQALLAAANQTSKFGDVWKAIEPTVSDTAKSVTAQMNNLSDAINNDGDAVDASQIGYKDLSKTQQTAADTLQQYFIAAGTGQMTTKQLQATIDGLKKSSLSATDQMSLLEDAILHSGNQDEIANFQAIQKVFKDCGDQASLTTGQVLAMTAAMEGGATDSIVETWAAKQKNLKGASLATDWDAYVQSPEGQAAIKAGNIAANPPSSTGGGNPPPGSTPTPTTFTGTTAEKAMEKMLQGNLDAQNAQLKIVKNQLSDQQKISQEVKAQLQYQQQISGLQSDMKNAMITGNYLQAATLKQQISGAKVDFNATSTSQQLQDQADTMQTNADAINQALSDLKDAIANNVTTISSSITAASKIKTINTTPVNSQIALGQAQVTTVINVTGTVDSTSTTSTHPGIKPKVVKGPAKPGDVKVSNIKGTGLRSP